MVAVVRDSQLVSVNLETVLSESKELCVLVVMQSAA